MMHVMKKKMRSLWALLLVLSALLPINASTAYAYTFDNLSAYIENPEFHDNQKGRLVGNVGMYKYVNEVYARTNVEAIYFDSTHKSFQILARRYGPTKGIDKTSKDMKWSVVDERICTVDSKGFVTAGDMTGATIVILEDNEYCISIPVINRTGKYDSWYEDMFKDIKILYTIYPKAGFKNESSAKLACEILGSGYKIIVDAYLDYGSALRTDPEVRFNTIYKAVNTVNNVALLSNVEGIAWGNCEVVSSLTSIICDPFVTNTSTQRFGTAMVEIGLIHINNAILLDGIIYSVENGNFEEVAKESDWTWNDGDLYGSYMFGNIKAEVEIRCYKLDSYRFTDDRDCITKYLKSGVYSN
jgi:hypothetical protein